MGILGIRNRTENWKTASYFVPLRMSDSVSALADRLTGKSIRRSEQPQMELFWKGVRDFFHDPATNSLNKLETVSSIYNDQFADLREDIRQFDGFRELLSHNYDASTPERQSALFDNVYNTEVDIVLEDSDCLYIGEAKHEMGFGANGRLVLVPQLVRQYVMASVLIELSPEAVKKKIVPFVVGGDVGKLQKSNQVKFMIGQGWLQEHNVLDWQEVAEMAQ